MGGFLTRDQRIDRFKVIKYFLSVRQILSELFIMDKSNAEVLEKIQMGYRMPRPQDCPEVREISKILFFNIF